MAVSTASVYVARVRRFLAWCAPDGELAGLAASDVTGAVLQTSVTVSVSATKLFVTALRSFLRFSFMEGLTPSDLSAAALSVARRRRSSLPMGIDGATADAFLRSCDRRQPKGRRDYAVLFILLRLGLRAGEVPACTRRTSTGGPARSWFTARRSRRPAPATRDVGEAIAAYLQKGRQNRTMQREVFLRTVAPRAAWKRAGSRSSCAAPVCGRA